MELTYICTIIGVFIFISFVTGFYIGTKIVANKRVEIKTPIEVIKEKKEVKKMKHQENYDNLVYSIIMDNIDNYDGSGLGQKDIPERK